MSCEGCTYLPSAGAGSGGFGSMPFGSATSGSMAIGTARAITANSVLVTYTGTISNTNPWSSLSPLFASNWTLVAVDPLDAVIRLAQTVVPSGAQAFIVFFDGILTPGAVYEIHLSTPDVIISGCDTACFTAVLIHPTAVRTDERSDDGFIRDIGNPATFRDSLPLQSPASYQITDTGDLALDRDGAAGLRKRILRRLTSSPGDYFHLGDYGLGAEIKTLLTPDVVRRIQSRATAQVKKEPEVVGATVVVGALAQNVLTLTVRVVTKAGDSVDITVPISLP